MNNDDGPARLRLLPIGRIVGYHAHDVLPSAQQFVDRTSAAIVLLDSIITIGFHRWFQGSQELVLLILQQELDSLREDYDEMLRIHYRWDTNPDQILRRMDVRQMIHLMRESLKRERRAVECVCGRFIHHNEILARGVSSLHSLIGKRKRKRHGMVWHMDGDVVGTVELYNTRAADSINLIHGIYWVLMQMKVMRIAWRSVDAAVEAVKVIRSKVYMEMQAMEYAGHAMRLWKDNEPPTDRSHRHLERSRFTMETGMKDIWTYEREAVQLLCNLLREPVPFDIWIGRMSWWIPEYGLPDPYQD